MKVSEGLLVRDSLNTVLGAAATIAVVVIIVTVVAMVAVMVVIVITEKVVVFVRISVSNSDVEN